MKALDRSEQGADVYSEDPSQLCEAKNHIRARPDRDRIRAEVLPLARYVPSAEEHQNQLDKFFNDYCHTPGRSRGKASGKVAPQGRLGTD